MCAPGRFTTATLSKRLNYLIGRFKTLFGFEMTWPFQNLTCQSDLSYDFQQGPQTAKDCCWKSETWLLKNYVM